MKVDIFILAASSLLHFPSRFWYCSLWVRHAEGFVQTPLQQSGRVLSQVSYGSLTQGFRSYISCCFWFCYSGFVPFTLTPWYLYIMPFLDLSFVLPHVGTVRVQPSHMEPFYWAVVSQPWSWVTELSGGSHQCPGSDSSELLALSLLLRMIKRQVVCLGSATGHGSVAVWIGTGHAT